VAEVEEACLANRAADSSRGRRTGRGATGLRAGRGTACIAYHAHSPASSVGRSASTSSSRVQACLITTSGERVGAEQKALKTKSGSAASNLRRLLRLYPRLCRGRVLVQHPSRSRALARWPHGARHSRNVPFALTYTTNFAAGPASVAESHRFRCGPLAVESVLYPAVVRSRSSALRGGTRRA